MSLQKIRTTKTLPDKIGIWYFSITDESCDSIVIMDKFSFILGSFPSKSVPEHHEFLSKFDWWEMVVHNEEISIKQPGLNQSDHCFPAIYESSLYRKQLL